MWCAAQWQRTNFQSDCPLDLVGPQTSRTDINVARRTVNDCFHTLDVRLPRAVGPSVGVGNLDPERDALATNIAFRHCLHLLAAKFSLKTLFPIIADSVENCNRFQKRFFTYFSFRPVAQLKLPGYNRNIEVTIQSRSVAAANLCASKRRGKLPVWRFEPRRTGLRVCPVTRRAEVS